MPVGSSWQPILTNNLDIIDGSVGIHLRDIPVENLPPTRSSLKMLYISTVLNTPVPGFVKTSLLLFLLRLSSFLTPQKLSIQFLCVVNMLSAIGSTIALIFSCHPIGFWWDGSAIPIRHKCVDFPPYFVFQIAFGFTTDLLTFAVAVWIFGRL